MTLLLVPIKSCLVPARAAATSVVVYGGALASHPCYRLPPETHQPARRLLLTPDKRTQGEHHAWTASYC